MTSLATRLIGGLLLICSSFAQADDEAAPSSPAHHNQPLVVQAHLPTYLLPLSYNGHLSDDEQEHTEIKYQLSFKLPLVNNLLLPGDSLYFAYTQMAYWQAYNKDISSPFRETNYQPELFWQLSRPLDWYGFDSQTFALGFRHQSNGQRQPRSRSWDRLYVNYGLSNADWEIQLEGWWRRPEARKESAQEADGDDNPDIEEFLGNGEIRLRQHFSGHMWELMLRNSWRDNHGAVQLGYVFPMIEGVGGYLEYFNGYGDSLIDYNHSVNRISLGIMLGHWY